MNKYVSLIAISLMLVGCGPDKSGTEEKSNTTSQEQVKSLSSGINLDYMDTSTRPGDDFNKYSIGKWMEITEIPSDRSRWGTFSILRDDAQAKVKNIIEASASGTHEFGSDEQKVGDLYKSYMNMEKRDALGVTPLAGEMARIDDLQNHADLAPYFATANIWGLGNPFGLIFYPDMKAPDRYAMYTWQGGLGLPDREYYLKTDEKSEKIKAAYQQHVEKMLTLAGIENAAQHAATIMALETRFAEQHLRKEDTRNMMKLYNRVEVGKLNEVMPDFDWAEFLKAARLENLEALIITQPSYMKALNDIITSTDMVTWRIFLKWHLINANASRLNTAMDDQNFAFYGKTLSGQPEQRPRWRRATAVVSGNLSEVIGKIYVKKHFPPEAKARMQEMIANLTKAYEASIKDLDWMGEETKKEALKKLGKFNAKIGYPDKWRDYSALEVKGDDLFGNMMRAGEFGYNYNLEKLAKPVDRHEWNTTPQTVNAFYNPPMNDITFPAAILQPPFFDMSADDAVNYGGIGAVIGHEIGHGFDDQGSTFDGDGILRNWWTDEDRTEFKKRTGALVEQYNGFKVFDDLNVNGEFTLGKNIGDLGGLSIALKAYKMSLNGKKAQELDGFTGVQRVFLGWGQAWLRKIREKAMRHQVATDPHAPAKFRVNGVVRNIPEFYEAFNVKPGDKLYLPPEKRVKIW